MGKVVSCPKCKSCNTCVNGEYFICRDCGHRFVVSQTKSEEEAKIREELARYLDLAAKNPKEYLPKVAETLCALAKYEKDAGNLQEARDNYHRALDVYAKIVKLDPKSYRSDVPRGLHSLGCRLMELGELQDAEQAWMMALPAWYRIEEERGSDIHETALTLHGLAELMMEMGRYQEAEAYFREAITAKWTNLNSGASIVSSSLGAILIGYGELLKATGRVAKGKEYCDIAENTLHDMRWHCEPQLRQRVEVFLKAEGLI